MADVAGLEIIGLPEDITPLAALVIIKALDEDGTPAYYVRATDSLTTVEAVGMVAYGDTQLRQTWDEEPED